MTCLASDNSGHARGQTHLLDLPYEAAMALPHEKAAAFSQLHAEIDRVHNGTIHSRQQIKDMLYNDGYRNYARRRRLQEQNGI
jgi:hypothetical protein